MRTQAPKGTRTMECPRCKAPMIIVEQNQIELDHCLSCHGIWFDGEELELLFSSLKLERMVESLAEIMALPGKPVEEKRLRCPRCRRKMEKVVVRSDPEELLDRCTHGDGLWFDGGELHRVLAHLHEATDGAVARAVAFVERVFPRPLEDGNTGEAK